MSHIHQRKGNYKAEPAVVVDYLLNAVDDKGEIDETVQPHRVHKLDYHIAHKGVENAEKH